MFSICYRVYAQDSGYTAEPGALIEPWHEIRDNADSVERICDSGDNRFTGIYRVVKDGDERFYAVVVSADKPQAEWPEDFLVHIRSLTRLLARGAVRKWYIDRGLPLPLHL